MLSPALVIRWAATNQLYSKSLYEAKRREWGFSKKSKAGDWADVGRITKIRRYCHGKESEVYRSGELISTKKLKKEISRHLLPTLQKQNSSSTIRLRALNTSYQIFSIANFWSSYTASDAYWLLYMYSSANVFR